MSKDPIDPGIERCRHLDTATLSDALDRNGIAGQCYGIRAVDTQFQMVGRAYTLRYGPAGHPAGTVGDYIDDVPPGSVIVLDNGGREDATVWGDILTEIAHRRGVAGTVIDGINRDSALCRRLGYPIFSRGVWMRTGKDRVQVEQVNGPVSVGGVRVSAGDLLRGDADGVVVIPRGHEDGVLEAAGDIERAERAIRESTRTGQRLDDARREFNYHRLQSKRRT